MSGCFDTVDDYSIRLYSSIVSNPDFVNYSFVLPLATFYTLDPDMLTFLEGKFFFLQFFLSSSPSSLSVRLSSVSDGANLKRDEGNLISLF